MIEYVIGGVLHGADTKDQIKSRRKDPVFLIRLNSLTRWTLKANKRAKERNRAKPTPNNERDGGG